MENNQAFQELFMSVLDGIGEVLEYSGRTMFGKTCIGVVLCDNQPHTLAAMVAITASVIRELLDGDTGLDTNEATVFAQEQLSNVRQDSMGKDSILYWPNIPYIK
jgi:hypothetical protein